MDAFTTSPTDVAQGWLDYLFNGKPMPQDFDQMGAAVDQGLNLQSAFTSALAFYSNAILVFAAFILFYQLVAMVAETAHHGVAMGKRANQIWAPIRLVVAIGLLVPVNGGLNSGQYIVVKMASLGSALASNVWSGILQATSGSNQHLAAPAAPLVAQSAMDIIEMEACRTAFNARMNCLEQSFPAYAAMEIPLPTGIATTIGNQTGSKYSYSSPALSDQDICGSYFVPNAPTSGTATYQAEVAALQNETSANGDFATAGQEIRQVMLPEQGTTLADSCIFSTGQTGGGDIHLNPVVTTAISNYQNGITSAVSTTFQSNSNNSIGGMQQAAETIQPLGWVFAGTYLNTIDRLQGDIARSVQSGLPTTVAPSLTITPNAAAQGYANTEEAWNIRAQVSKDLAAFHVLAKEDIAAAPQCASMVGLNNDAEKGWHVGSSLMSLLFGMIDHLATRNGVWKTSNAPTCGTNTPATGQNTFTVGVQINGADPLAQMAALGHANINTAFDLLAAGVGTKVAGGLVSLLPTKVAGLGGMALSGLGGLLTALALVFFASGFVLAYLIPLMPFLRFFFSVLTWVGALVEAIVFMPLVALAHLSIEGEGLSGHNAHSAYYFVFNLFLRPVLTVFGLIASLLIFYVALDLINFTYNAAISGAGGTVNGNEALTRLVYSTLYVVVIYLIANHAFMLIDHVPTTALAWIGKSGQNMQSMGDVSRMETGAATVSTIVARDALGGVSKMADGGYASLARYGEANRSAAQQKNQKGGDAKYNSDMQNSKLMPTGMNEKPDAASGDTGKIDKTIT